MREITQSELAALKPGDIFGAIWESGLESVCIVDANNGSRIDCTTVNGQNLVSFDAVTGRLDREASRVMHKTDCRITFVGQMPGELERIVRSVNDAVKDEPNAFLAWKSKGLGEPLKAVLSYVSAHAGEVAKVGVSPGF